MNRFVAFLILLLCMPLFALVAIAIKMDSKGSVILKQKRVGHKKEIFICYKFRTMKVGTLEVATHLASPMAVTSVGRMLRVSKIDELPQLFNVLCGQMSLVGPRPLPIRDVKKMNSWHQIRHQVLPGITSSKVSPEQLDSSSSEQENTNKDKQTKNRNLYIISEFYELQE